MPDEDDEFMDWEEWSTLSDRARDALLDSEIRQYNEIWDRMSRSTQIKCSISSALESCVKWRRALNKFDLPIIRKHLRDRQKRLLALRIERNSGNIVGHS